MPNCISLSTIDSQLSCQEQDNMGGLVPQLIFGYHDDVASWPDWPAPAANPVTPLTLDAAGAITGDLVMGTGVCAYKMDFTEEQGSFSIAPQGDPGAISFLYTLNIINRRIRKKLLGFMNAAKNRKMFFLVQDANTPAPENKPYRLINIPFYYIGQLQTILRNESLPPA